MSVRDAFMRGLARQLGHPAGLRGRVVARSLNKGNLAPVLAAVEATGALPGQQVADIGFGGGVGLQPLLDRVGPGGHVHGVDIAETMLDAARKKYSTEVASGSLTLEAGDLTALPLPDHSLDALITTNTIYFVEDVSRAFREMARVLKPGGRAVVGCADPDFMTNLPFTQHGFRIRPITEVIELIRGAGLTFVEDRRIDHGNHAFHLLVAESPS